LNKREFTETIIKDAKLPIDIEIDDALQEWWWTNREDLRLTYKGFRCLAQIYKPNKFNLKAQLTGYTYKQLNKINCVYFITRDRTIYIFSTKITTIITLYKTLDNYLEVL